MATICATPVKVASTVVVLTLICKSSGQTPTPGVAPTPQVFPPPNPR